VGGINDLNR